MFFAVGSKDFPFISGLPMVQYCTIQHHLGWEQATTLQKRADYSIAFNNVKVPRPCYTVLMQLLLPINKSV